MRTRIIFTVLRNDGLEGVVLRLWNRFRFGKTSVWTPLPASNRNQTSSSDSGSYPSFCAAAAKSDRLFHFFRRHPAYMPVLEHVSKRLGRAYLHQIQRVGYVSNAQVREIARNVVGSPFRYWFPGLGRISMTDLRYLKVASDLHELFGSTHELHIVEIGVGFGGQCRVLSAVDGWRQYTLFDLPEVLSLSDRFLRTCAVDGHLQFLDGTAPEVVASDLCISNYAFSELRRDLQDAYLARVILKSKRGYVTFNSVTSPYLNGMSIHEFVAQIPGSRIVEETPLSELGNAIVVWGI